MEQATQTNSLGRIVNCKYEQESSGHNHGQRDAKIFKKFGYSSIGIRLNQKHLSSVHAVYIIQGVFLWAAPICIIKTTKK